MLGLWEARTGPQRMNLHVAFAADLDDVLRAPSRLLDLGIPLLDLSGNPADEPVVLAWMPAVSVYFRDPDGHLLEYISMLDAAPRPELGVLGWSVWTNAHHPEV